MISNETLARAVAEDIITAAQAERLRALHDAAAPPPPMDAWSGPARESPDEESLRFIGGFSDIFVAIGLFLFLGAASYFLQHFLSDTALWLGLGGLAWLLAEFFTRRRRMALPSIILLGFFAVSVFSASTELIGGWSPAARFAVSHALRGNELASVAFAGLITAGFAGLHYWRFRVPITVAAGAAALSATFIGLVLALWQTYDLLVLNGLILLCGLAIFILAMRFDSSDPQRLTRRTDIAFWLHLLAAPLIVHPVIAFFHRDITAAVEPPTAIAILVIFVVFALVALAIDRRALLVSGLIYAGIAFGTLLSQSGFTDLMLPTTLLALGAFVLLLSAGWQPLRRAVLYLFPAPLLRRLPPLSA